jgi:Heavy metal binding domain
MDPDVHLSAPGKCPRCGMTLVLKIPDRTEYNLNLEVQPALPQPDTDAALTLRALSPEGKPVSTFEIVHERLMHLFVVSQNLEVFQHIHPELGSGDAFRVRTHLPLPGMYRLLADYYPAGSVPQLSLATLYAAGDSLKPHLQPALVPQQASNLKASLRIEPAPPTAGLLSRLFFTLDPGEGLELYLGTWAHMLIASADLIDMIHTHPFLAGGANIQFNVIFPRPGLHRIWTQFQRKGVVNTVVFTVPVQAV